MPYVERSFDPEFIERLRGLREAGDLVEMAAVVAEADGHALDMEGTAALLDELAAALRDLPLVHSSCADRARALSDAFVRKLGFNGCDNDYYNPRNSYLDHVLTRREGIPVSLALVYLELGRRLDLRLVGVNFPGHFLVAVLEPDGNEGVLIDPFGNIVLSHAECAERLKRQFGEHAVLQPEHFVRASRQGIAVRMLGNLKAIRLNAGDTAAAVRLCSAALEIMPEHPGELSDRARLLEQLERCDEAIDDLVALKSLLGQERTRGVQVGDASGAASVDVRRQRDLDVAFAAIDQRIDELRRRARPILH